MKQKADLGVVFINIYLHALIRVIISSIHTFICACSYIIVFVFMLLYYLHALILLHALMSNYIYLHTLTLIHKHALIEYLLTYCKLNVIFLIISPTLMWII